MKLYTKEQVRKAWNTAFTEALRIDEEDYNPTFYGEFMNDLTPIELPSDGEIIIARNEVNGVLHKFGFRLGAKWVIEQIKEQGK